MKRKRPQWLPSFLRSWLFLPQPLRSFEPWDRIITYLPCCKSCRHHYESDDATTVALKTDSNKKTQKGDMHSDENGRIRKIETHLGMDNLAFEGDRTRL